MSDKKTKLKAITTILRNYFSKISIHYFAYTVALLFVTFSVMHFVTAATPNPGHPWNEIGDGVFAVTYNQTALRTYTFPDANATVLTTNAAVTVAQGGTGITTIASGSILGANSLNTLSAITSTTGTKVLTNTGGTITWETAPSSMVYPGAGIPNSTGSAWGTSYTTTGSGTVLALATSPSFTTPSLGVATATSINGLSLTANATGFSVAGGTTSKTLTVSNTLTLAGTDSSTLNIGTGGTLGTGAFADISNYVPYTGATTGVVLGANILSTTSGFITPKIYPASDSTTAFQITKANGTTNVLNVDTTNTRVGVGKVPTSRAFEVQGDIGYSGYVTNGSLFLGVSNGYHGLLLHLSLSNPRVRICCHRQLKII